VPQAKKPKVEVVLPNGKPMKGVVKFTTEDRPVPVTNVYLVREFLQKLGNPDAIKVTIEPADQQEA
jgi:hypothetical protein